MVGGDIRCPEHRPHDGVLEKLKGRLLFALPRLFFLRVLLFQVSDIFALGWCQRARKPVAVLGLTAAGANRVDGQ
jgi:hypothetical protein